MPAFVDERDDSAPIIYFVDNYRCIYDDEQQRYTDDHQYRDVVVGDNLDLDNFVSRDTVYQWRPVDEWRRRLFVCRKLLIMHYLTRLGVYVVHELQLPVQRSVLRQL